MRWLHGGYEVIVFCNLFLPQADLVLVEEPAFNSIVLDDQLEAEWRLSDDEATIDWKVHLDATEDGATGWPVNGADRT